MDWVERGLSSDITSFLRSQSDSVPAQQLQLRWRKLAYWLAEGRRLAEAAGQHVAPDRRLALWQKFIGDVTYRAFKTPGLHSGSFRQLIWFLRDHKRKNEDELLLPPSKSTRDFGNAMESWANDRRFCRTRDGRIGCVPRSVIVGDTVCVLYGGRVPYVLRPVGDGKYILIGDCFIHGLMDGEAMAMKQIPRRTFAQR